MRSNNPKLSPGMYFESPDTQIDLNVIYKWYLTEVLGKIWNKSEWQRTAKGGEWPDKPSWASNFDMPYLAHIISGASLALKVLEIALHENKISIEEKLQQRIKRGLVGYLFHDYNKLTGTPKDMRAKKELDSLISDLPQSLYESLELGPNELYQIAFSTEIGTTANSLRNEVKISTDLTFELEISRLADELSSAFNNIPNTLRKDIHFHGLVLKKEKIRLIKFTHNIFYAFSDLLRKEIIQKIAEVGGIYLWTTSEGIYYYGNEFNTLAELDDLKNKVLKSFLSKLNVSKVMKCNDRKIELPTEGIIEIKLSDMKDYFCDNRKFMEVLKPEDKSFGESELTVVNSYIEHTRALSSIAFRINLDSFKFRDLVSLNDISSYDEKEILERTKLFLLRYLQLNPEFKSKNANILRKALSDISIRDAKMLEPFLGRAKGKNKEKSVFLLPLVLLDNTIGGDVWERVFAEFETFVNSGLTPSRIAENEKSVSNILSTVLGHISRPLPVVPEKKSMSIINSYPAQYEAKAESMYALATNSTFSNRLTTSAISFARVDIDYKLEALLRKCIIPQLRSDFSRVVMYVSFPGAISYIDMAEVLTNWIRGRGDSEPSNLEELFIGLIDTYERDESLKVDSSFWIGAMNVDNLSDALSVLTTAIIFSKNTKMKCFISEAHSPSPSLGKEILVYDAPSFSMNDLGITRIRYNKLDEVLNLIETFSVLSNKSIRFMDFKKMAPVIRGYLSEPLSIFSQIKRLMNENGNKKRGGNQKLGSLLGSDFMNRISDIENLIDRPVGIKEKNNGVEKMEEIKNLAKAALRLKNPGDSSNKRTWLVRDSLYALEKWKSNTGGTGNHDLADFLDILDGQILKGLERENIEIRNHTYIDDFSRALISALDKLFGGRVPSGSMKSYFIDAFEFEYLLEYENAQRGGK